MLRVRPVYAVSKTTHTMWKLFCNRNIAATNGNKSIFTQLLQINMSLEEQRIRVGGFSIGSLILLLDKYYHDLYIKYNKMIIKNVQSFSERVYQ